MAERPSHEQIDAASAASLAPRLVLLLAAFVLAVGLVGSTAAQVAAEPTPVRAHDLTPQRVAASVAVLIALLGTVVGGVALIRSAGRMGSGAGRHGGIAALLLAPVGIVIGGLVVATADGGLGSGNGLGGGVVAMTVGAIGAVFGGLALTRSRRTD